MILLKDNKQKITYKKEVENMDIYMNGKQTAYENIFDLLEVKNIAQWYNASDALIGRKLKKVLDDWGNTHKTYYYINGTRYDFELR